MCLTISTWIPVPHFTLFRGKKVYKGLDPIYDIEGIERKVLGYITPFRYVIVPEDGIMIPNKVKMYEQSIVWSSFDKSFLIYAGFIHCFVPKRYKEYTKDDMIDIHIFEATIPRFTLYFKGNNGDIACKKLIIHLPK